MVVHPTRFWTSSRPCRWPPCAVLVARPKIFSRLGIETVSQLRAIPLPISGGTAGGKAAASFRDQALGIASAESGTRAKSKKAFQRDNLRGGRPQSDILHDVLRGLAAEVAATARRENLSGSVVTLKIRFVGFETHTRQRTIPVPTRRACDPAGGLGAIPSRRPAPQTGAAHRGGYQRLAAGRIATSRPLRSTPERARTSVCSRPLTVQQTGSGKGYCSSVTNEDQRNEPR